MVPGLRSLCTRGSNAAAQRLRFAVLSLKTVTQSTRPEEVTLEKVNLIITLQMGLSLCSGFEEIVAITAFSLGTYLKDGSSFSLI